MQVGQVCHLRMCLIKLPHIIEEVLLNRTTCYAFHKGGVMLQELIFNTLPSLIPTMVIGYPGCGV